MNKREAHYYLEELQRMMTQHRGIFSNEFVCANGMAIQALEKPDITLESAIDFLHKIGWLQEHDRIMSERKKGKWIEHRDYPGLAYLCSNCDYFTTLESYYCPNCGADMKGEQDG